MIDDMDEWLVNWRVFSSEARQRLSIIQNREIQSDEFVEAVKELWGAKDQLHMLYLPIPTVDEILEQLQEYHFESLLGEPLQTVALSESILPEDWPKLLQEQVIRQGGEQWEIHKYDADPFPSNPHAHNHELRVKLHLGTGELYKKHKSVGRIKCKDLRKLRALVTESIDLPAFECE